MPTGCKICQISGKIEGKGGSKDVWSHLLYPFKAIRSGYEPILKVMQLICVSIKKPGPDIPVFPGS